LTDVAWSGEMQHVGTEPLQFAGDSPRVPPQRDVEAEIVLQAKRRQLPPFELEPHHRTLLDDSRFRTGMNGEEWHLAARGVILERARRASDAVRFVVRVAE